MKSLIICFTLIGVLFFQNYVLAATKDLTFSSCVQLKEKGFKKMNISNSLYLMGRENGIEKGIRLTYKDNRIESKILDEGYGNYVMEKACSIVLSDTSEKRGMVIFDEAVFKIITQKTPLGNLGM